MKNTIILSLILTIAGFSKINAQSYIDILNIGYSQNAEAPYEDFQNNHYSQKSFWLNLNVPIELKGGKDVLIPGAYYENWKLNNDFYEDDELNFHNAYTSLGWMKEWKNPYWASFAQVGLGLSSDFKSISENHFNLGATLLFYYGKKESLVWNFGVDYVTGSFGDWFVPLIGVDWGINEKLSLSFSAFSHLHLEYQFGQRIAGGVQLLNAPYNFNLSEYFGLEDSSIYSFSDAFPYAPQQAMAFVDVYLSEETVLFAKVGYAFANEIFHYDIDGNIIEESAYNGKIDPGMVFQFGFAYRVAR